MQQADINRIEVMINILEDCLDQVSENSPYHPISRESKQKGEIHRQVKLNRPIKLESVNTLTLEDADIDDYEFDENFDYADLLD